MAATRGDSASGRLVLASGALFVAQLIHGLTPVDTEHESLVGPVAGSLLLLASLVATVGAWRGRPWAAPLAGGAGALVAGGFVLYHSLPIHSPVTNPYFGEDVGALPWVTVVVAVAAGAWAAYEGLVVDRRVSSTV